MLVGVADSATRVKVSGKNECKFQARGKIPGGGLTGSDCRPGVDQAGEQWGRAQSLWASRGFKELGVSIFLIGRTRPRAVGVPGGSSRSPSPNLLPEELLEKIFLMLDPDSALVPGSCPSRLHGALSKPYIFRRTPTLEYPNAKESRGFGSL